MTGQELYNKIIRYYKRDDKDIELWEAVNETITDMLRAHSFDGGKKVDVKDDLIISGGYRFRIPSKTGILLDVILVDDSQEIAPLERINKDNFDRLYPNIENDNATGVPTIYSVFGGYVYVAPKPQKEYGYKLCFVRSEMAIVDKNTETVPLGDFGECIKFGALYRLTLGVEDEPTAARYKNLYEAELHKAVNYDRLRTQSIRIVRAYDC
jgi:hypothetical protein